MKIFSKKPIHIHFKCNKCNNIKDIKNEELINLFNRLSPSDQQSIIKEIRQRVEETEKLKQKNMFKKL